MMAPHSFLNPSPTTLLHSLCLCLSTVTVLSAQALYSARLSPGQLHGSISNLPPTSGRHDLTTVFNVSNHLTPAHAPFLPFSPLPFSTARIPISYTILQWQTTFPKNIAPAVCADPHPQIKRGSLYALPLNLGGPLRLPPLAECGRSDPMWSLKAGP